MKVVWMGEVRRVSMWLGNPWLSVNVIACLDQSKYIVAAIGAGLACATTGLWSKLHSMICYCIVNKSLLRSHVLLD